MEQEERKQLVEPQEMTPQVHDQPCKIAEEIPADEKFSKRSELPSSQYQQEENVQSNSLKEVKPQQLSTLEETIQKSTIAKQEPVNCMQYKSHVMNQTSF